MWSDHRVLYIPLKFVSVPHKVPATLLRGQWVWSVVVGLLRKAGHLRTARGSWTKKTDRLIRSDRVCHWQKVLARPSPTCTICVFFGGFGTASCFTLPGLTTLKRPVGPAPFVSDRHGRFLWGGPFYLSKSPTLSEDDQPSEAILPQRFILTVHVTLYS